MMLDNWNYFLHLFFPYLVCNLIIHSRVSGVIILFRRLPIYYLSPIDNCVWVLDRFCWIASLSSLINLLLLHLDFLFTLYFFLLVCVIYFWFIMFMIYVFVVIYFLCLPVKNQLSYTLFLFYYGKNKN
ncbi:hypothetical protein ACJIZ3_005820 [Penstemon smallii]|uniref:Uncharacterized protein n=1 Tax=Penstemon smallii TaxID=265156 RepID=A0ABD3S5Y8_9LAMI